MFVVVSVSDKMICSITNITQHWTPAQTEKAHSTVWMHIQTLSSCCLCPLRPLDWPWCFRHCASRWAALSYYIGDCMLCKMSKGSDACITGRILSGKTHFKVHIYFMYGPWKVHALTTWFRNLNMCSFSSRLPTTVDWKYPRLKKGNYLCLYSEHKELLCKTVSFF